MDFRDRAILKFYLYTGARISTGIRLRVSDFHQDGDEATIRLHEKGDHRRTIGLHFAAAQAITEYLERGQITAGPLFRPQLNPRSKKLSTRHFSRAAMYELVLGYLKQLPGATKERTGSDGAPEKTSEGMAVSDCIYTPHSLRATTATLLLDAEVDIRKVQELLGHRHITTTQIYDKRRISTKDSASHKVPI